MRYLRVVACGFLVLATGCQPADQAETADGTATEKAAPDAAADQAALDKLREDWVAAAERDDAATVANMYEPNAVYIGDDAVTASGQQAIQTLFTESFKSGSELKVTPGPSEVVGDVGYSNGTFTQKARTPDGKTVDVEGSYLVVSRRQTDGSWKIVRHMGTVKPPATPN